MPEENFWTLWCKGRLTEADTPTIRLGATPSGLSSAHLHHPIVLNYFVTIIRLHDLVHWVLYSCREVLGLKQQVAGPRVDEIWITSTP